MQEVFKNYLGKDFLLVVHTCSPLKGFFCNAVSNLKQDFPQTLLPAILLGQPGLREGNSNPSAPTHQVKERQSFIAMGQQRYVLLHECN